ncbi:MAG: hypothetical protein ACI4DN_11985 [Lachnospiraceae bacterium]
MGKRQIEKEFDRLYVGQNQKLLVENYYKKKKRDMGIILLSMLFLCGLLSYQLIKESRLNTENSIERNLYGEGKKRIELEVKKGEEEWQQLTLTLEEKEYSEAEIEEYTNLLMEELEQYILGENSSVDEVKSDLYLPRQIEGYPLYLSWKSSNPQLLDGSGKISFQNLTRTEELVCLTVFMEYGEWKKEHSFYIRVMEKGEESISFIQRLSGEIEALEEESRREKMFNLPQASAGEALSWRYPVNKGILLLIALLPVSLMVIWKEKDRQIHRQARVREDRLLEGYPQLVSKLVLLMEAGMTLKGAIYRVVQDYLKKQRTGKAEHYLYEELKYICHKMDNGLGEREAYELFGKRCELPLYKKLSTLFIQYHIKGDSEFLEHLRRESWQANEEGKNRIKRKGEELGTKLLLPMMLMLGMVMLLIIVPACFSFQL